MTLTTSAFNLPDSLAAKAEPTLIAGDEGHFVAIADSLEQSIAELSGRIDVLRRARSESGGEAVERDMEIHRLTSRLRALRRFGLDLCLGRMVGQDGVEPVYVGRFGLTDSAGKRLLLDWRSPAAEPFFGATHANPMGLSSRRRYRWTRGRVSDYWDEVFTADAIEGHAALDDQSAFIASLGSERSERMRDVLGTIQADQDAIIRAGSLGPLVVDGGPGTGKTVVALHRTAYLLYSDPRLGHRKGGVLFVGPHQPYLSYVSDVLPSLGEEGVQTCTLRNLVPEGSTAAVEADPEIARLKADARMVRAIEPAVALYEKPPTRKLDVETPWGDATLDAQDWAEAFQSVEPGTPHNEAREQVWEALVGILSDKLTQPDYERDVDDPYSDEDAYGEPESSNEDEFDAYGLKKEIPDAPLRQAFAANRELTQTFGRAWPIIEASDVVGDLWQEPAYLRACAPWLEEPEIDGLQRQDAASWTVSDLPLLDAARRRLGDPEASRLLRRQEAAVAEERARMADVIENLIATDDSEMGVMQMLRGQDLRETLVDGAALPVADPDLLAGPFAHIVVDEAQELTDAEWQMLLARCPSRSLTIVGDRAQARHGFTESWRERLERVGLRDIHLASLTVNYRTPAEVMEEAEHVIRSAIPDANVPTSIRSSGVPVRYGDVSELDKVLGAWLSSNDVGVACVVSARAPQLQAIGSNPRVRALSPELTKGLEFDLVILIDPETFGEGIEGVVDRYVAMTRATQRLVILRTTEAV